jgi:hypothetical protein
VNPPSSGFEKPVQFAQWQGFLRGFCPGGRCGLILNSGSKSESGGSSSGTGSKDLDDALGGKGARAAQPDQGAEGDGEKALEAGGAAPPPEGDENKGDKQKKGTPERNVDQNKRVDDAARETGLDKQQRRELGRFIEQESRKYGENFSYSDILDAAERLKAGERLIYIK